MTLRLSSDSCFLNAKGVSDRHSQCWYRHPGAVGGGEAPRRCPFSQEHPLVHVFWYVLFFFFVLFFGLFVSLALWISPWIKKTNRSPMHTFFFLWSRTGTNEYVFAEMSTATNVLRGQRAAGRHGSADCLSSSLPSSLGRAPRGHMQGSFWSPLYFTRVPSFFSPSLPLTSKIFGSLSGLRKYHLSSQSPALGPPPSFS